MRDCGHNRSIQGCSRCHDIDQTRIGALESALRDVLNRLDLLEECVDPRVIDALGLPIPSTTLG